MDCKHANTLMMQYIDDDLNEADAVKLNKHLQNCEICKKEFIVYEMLGNEFDSFREESILIEAPVGFEIKVMEKVRLITPEYAKAPSLDSLFGTVFGIFSVTFGAGAIVAMHKESVIEYLIDRKSVV